MSEIFVFDGNADFPAARLADDLINMLCAARSLGPEVHDLYIQLISDFTAQFLQDPIPFETAIIGLAEQNVLAENIDLTALLEISIDDSGVLVFDNP